MSDNHTTIRQPVANLVKRYLVALLLVAGFTTASWYSQDQLLNAEKETALIVNISGRQRMLSQRSALMANLLAKTKDVAASSELRHKLRETIDLMEKSHLALTQGDLSMQLSGKMSPAIHQLYFAGEASVNYLVEQYISQVRAFLALPGEQLLGQSPQLDYLTDTALTVLVASLDQVVRQYQQEGSAAITTIHRQAIVFWLATLMLLLLEAAFIFQPFARKLKWLIAELNAANSALKIHRDQLEQLINQRTESLVKSQAFTQDILDSIDTEIAVIDENATIIAVNRAWNQFAIDNGSNPQDANQKVGIGCNYLEVCNVSQSTPESIDIQRITQAIGGILNRAIDSFAIEYPCHSLEQKRWFYMTVAPMQALGHGAVITHHNITSRKLAEEGFRKFHIAVENSSAAVIITDKHALIEYVNPRFTLDTGYEVTEAIGRNPSMLSSGLAISDSFSDMLTCLVQGSPWHGEVSSRKKNGELFWQNACIAPIYDENQQVVNYVGVMTDITERKAFEQQIYDLAFNDELTKLPNRRLLRDRLNQALATSKRSQKFAALIYLDLDNFKPLNDTHGHEFGDLLLIDVAQRLRHHIRSYDTAARLGGDEFVILLAELDQSRSIAAATARQIAEKLLKELAEPYWLIGTGGNQTKQVTHRCTASLGVILFSGEVETSVDALLDRADKAMYGAKRHGRQRVEFAKD